MRLNLFKSIVSILVLFASGFIIAHADTELELGDCKGLNGCQETAGAFCTSMGIWVYKVAGTYEKCPDCTNDGTFGLFNPICGDASVYYSCSRQGTGPGLAYTRTEWFKNIVVADHFNYNCHAQCSCGGGDPPPPECSPGTYPQTCEDGTTLCCVGGRWCWRGFCYQDSPIIIDANGDGFDLTDEASGVIFDMDGDGQAHQISWTSPNTDDAFLFLDRNGNGAVDNGKELFGNLTPQSKPFSKNSNGFDALAEYDKPANGGNSDGQIDQRDGVYPSLRLWQDKNHNGLSDPGELHTLPELGVAILDLDYKWSKRVDGHGNEFRYRGKVRDVHGAQVGKWAWDVFLLRYRPK